MYRSFKKTFDVSVAVVYKGPGYHSVDWYWQINKWLSPNTDEDTIQPMLLCKIIEALFSHNAFTSFDVLKLKKRFKPLPDLLTLRKSSEQKQCYQFSSHCIQSSNTSDVWRYELWYCYQKPCSRIPLLCINIWVPQLQCHWICKGNRV